MTTAEEFGKQMRDAVKAYVAHALAPLGAQLATLSEKIAAIPQGERGEKGDPGEQGVPGIKGDPGKDGEPGRDAAELEILPSIDEAKSYRRGTWASHNGGLIKAVRQTDPITEGLVQSGWSVMVEGISAIVVAQGDDPREIEVASMLTSGTKAIAVFRLPIVIDRGVYRADERYAKGDGVTWGGSYSIAQKDEPQGEPGKSDDWRLAVRRGRDGKDLRHDEPPEVKVVNLK